MNNLEEKEEFLKRFNLPRLNQEERESMNKLITSTEIETVIKTPNNKKNKTKLLTNRSPGPDYITGKFHQTFREELTPILLELFKKTAEEYFQTHSRKSPSP